MTRPHSSNCAIALCHVTKSVAPPDPAGVVLSRDELRNVAMMDQTKAKPGRRPTGAQAMAGAERQARYVKDRQADLEGVARALWSILRTSEEEADVFRRVYGRRREDGGNPVGASLLRGLAICLKGDNPSNPDTLAFFESLIGLSSSDSQPS